MDSIEHSFNFNDPLELTVIFRTENKDEFAAKHCYCWEDVRGIEEYPYPDDWKQYKGPKFWLNLHGAESKLVYGEYQNMASHWRAFRNKYPLFVDHD